MSTSAKTAALKQQLKAGNKKFTFYNLNQLEKIGLPQPRRLPFSIKILLENAIRNCDDYQVNFDDVRKIANWSAKGLTATEIAFKPARVILQDFTGVPCVVDLAAMRSALKRAGGDLQKINPLVPCDLVIDHSVQTDAFGSKNAFAANIKKEFQRNHERYLLLKWAQRNFKNFTVVPPATGIIHQINLEYLARGILKNQTSTETLIYPDTVVGTDSHTTMINGLGIVGWGVGGIEAEAVMLGEPTYMLLPEVIGVRLTGKLSPGVTATDLVLTVTEILRKKGVVGKFVEFFGEGVRHLSVPDRATVSNMAPEYGATVGLFPADRKTMDYYRFTGRDKNEVALLERYLKEQGLFYYPDQPEPEFTEVLEIELSSIEPCLAGPKRPQDRVTLKDLKTSFEKALTAPVTERGFGLPTEELNKTTAIGRQKIAHGSLAIASITSCTNTSNPSLLLAAGLLAKNAVAKGLTVPGFVKTSFAPGSQVTEDYLKKAGLLKYLDKLGFNIVGYGCMTCIGNSGPLPEKVAAAIQENKLVAASVLSGNRNFEGRVNPHVKANYLASPPLVVAYALAGTVRINLAEEPLGKDKKGAPVFLRDIWPADKTIESLVKKCVTAKAFTKRYKKVYQGNKMWAGIKSKTAPLYMWDKKSTYIQEPPFFVNMPITASAVPEISNARVLAVLGDSVTTDHISPAGNIAADSPAGKYLQTLGVAPKDFNSYGSRRGNDRVMTRGTFANIRLRNLLVPGKEGSWTKYFPDDTQMSIFDAAEKYQETKIPLIIIAGKEYGSGSSRDWAAKGAALLGIRAVLAVSFERIHRSNLAGMGILPLQFKDGDTAENLKLSGEEIFNFEGINENLRPRQEIKVTAAHSPGEKKEFTVICRLDTPVEIDYFRNRGILPTVLRKLAK